MTCECGCGAQCVSRFVRGHNRRALAPNVRYAYSMPIQRVLPLVEFLFDIYRTNSGTARAVGVSEWAVRRWRGQHVRRVSPGACRLVVDAVKAQEAKLRAAAIEPESMQRRHERHTKRGEFDWCCDICARSGVSA